MNKLGYKKYLNKASKLYKQTALDRVAVNYKYAVMQHAIYCSLLKPKFTKYRNQMKEMQKEVQ